MAAHLQWHMLTSLDSLYCAHGAGLCPFGAEGCHCGHVVQCCQASVHKQCPSLLHEACCTAHTGGIITDLVSYYTLPSSIIGNDKYDSLKAAFMYYTVATETPLQDLMQDILILARDR